MAFGVRWVAVDLGIMGVSVLVSVVDTFHPVVLSFVFFFFFTSVGEGGLIIVGGDGEPFCASL